MVFEYDIYISYYSKDNQPSADRENGWVTNFEKFLDILLSQLMGRKVKILLSENADSNINAAAKACSTIFIITPEYLNSSIFNRDIAAFSSGDIKQINGKSRIYKVMKSHVPNEQLTDNIKSLPAYELFQYDPLTGVMKEFNNFFGQDAEKNYWMRLVDLSYDLYKLISMNSSVKMQNGMVLKGHQADNVYLAETGRELMIHREVIRRELEMHGYNILPSSLMNPHATEAENIIRNDLGKCRLSIHIIGDAFASDNDEEDEVMLMKLQNKIASEISNKKKGSNGNGVHHFARLLWIPPELKLNNEKQKLAIENLKRDAEVLNGAEVLQIPIEEFKSIIKKELDSEDSFVSSILSGSNESLPNSVYFVVDAMDIEMSKTLQQLLKDQGINIMLPLVEGDVLEIRKQHQLNLNNCDAVLIFCDRVSEQWVKSKVLDILKAPGFGRRKPMLAKALVANKQLKLDEAYYMNNKMLFMKSDMQYYPIDALQVFVQKVKNK